MKIRLAQATPEVAARELAGAVGNAQAQGEPSMLPQTAAAPVLPAGQRRTGCLPSVAPGSGRHPPRTQSMSPGWRQPSRTGPRFGAPAAARRHPSVTVGLGPSRLHNCPSR